MLKAGKVVALDTKHNLLSRFAGITVRLGADRVPAGWQARVLREEGGLHFVALDHYADLEMLLQEMRKEGLAIRELALLEAALEDVFLKIMSGDLRGAPAGAAP